jgi:hypothetical protein
MISNVSSAPTSTTVQQYPAARSAPPPSGTANYPQDTVQLSDVTQRAAAATQKQSAPQPAPPPTLGQLVKDAASGDITALAQLAVIG